jgi:hypothetical protein
MSKSKGILISLGIIILMLCFFFLPSRLGITPNSGASTTLFEAVPTDVAMIIEFNTYSKLQELLKNKNYTNDLKDIFLIDKLRSDFKLFDKVFYQNEENSRFIKENEVLCAAEIIESQSIDFLYVIPNNNLKIDLETFQTQWQANEQKYNQYVFEKISIHEFYFSKEERLFICLDNDMLLISRHSFLIEKSILQLQNRKGNISNQEDFLRVREKTGNNADCSIYLNFKNLALLLAHFTNKSHLADIGQLKKIGTWTGLDIRFLENGFDINGYMNTNELNPFFKSLKKEKLTDSIAIAKVLPENTTYALNFNSTNFQRFIKNKRSKKDFFSEYFLPWLGNSLTYVITEPTQKGFKNNQFWVAEVRDYEKAVALLRAFSQENGELTSVRYPPHNLRGFITDDLFQPIFGEKFSPIRNPYYTFINKKYVVFANNPDGLKQWVDKIDFNQSLSQDINYQEFTKDFPQTANLYQYFNLANAYQVLATYLHQDFHEALENEFQYFEKIKPITIHSTPYENLLVINLHAAFNQTGKQPTSVVWRSELDANAIIPPKVVINHDTGEKEIFIQDANYKVYLLNKNGQILWTKQLNGKILSKIHQIDFYKNKKLQYLFNTENKIHLLDRNGENVDNYPRKLIAKATNGITVLDYDGRQNYRIFVACADGNIYGFLQRGEPLSGWSPQPNIGIINQPIQHFVIDNLDYLIALNDTGLVYAFDRSGQMRIPPTPLELNGRRINSKFYFDDINSLHKRVVAMDSKGKAYVANLRGNKFNLSMLIGKNTNVKFCMVDLVGDIRKDYVLLSGQNLSINYYDEKGVFRKKHEITLPTIQDDLFPIQLLNQEKAYIATVSYQNNEIYLLDNKAGVIQDFPLAGSTRFEITDFFNDGKQILTVASDNWVYVYRLSFL